MYYLIQEFNSFLERVHSHFRLFFFSVADTIHLDLLLFACFCGIILYEYRLWRSV